jgi:two-component system LytT family response regulator
MLRTILVDDEPIILNELRESLENQQILIVGVYTDPLDALRELPETKPDCAFLDIEMPNMTGIELAERLVSANPALEIIFVTAYNHYASEAFNVSASDYLLKPIRPERIRKTIDKLRRNRGAEQPYRQRACSIRCFGSFEVLMEGRPVKWGRSKSKEFLAYMLQYEGKWVTKYRLCEEQWSGYEPEQALAYLQTSVYRLRKNLSEAGCTQLEIAYSGDRYILRVKDVDWDVRAFNEAVEVFSQARSSKAAQQAISLYRGEYLEGEDWLWSDIPREHYIRQYEKLLEAAEAND